MENESRRLLGGDYPSEQGGGRGAGGGVPMNLAMSGRGMMPPRAGEGSGSSDGQEEINVEDDGPVLTAAGNSGALPSHLRPDDGGCSSSDDSRKVTTFLFMATSVNLYCFTKVSSNRSRSFVLPYHASVNRISHFRCPMYLTASEITHPCIILSFSLLYKFRCFVLVLNLKIQTAKKNITP